MKDDTDLPSLLIVDDDAPFGQSLGRAMERRGFRVRLAATIFEATNRAQEMEFDYAVVDLRLQEGNGLELVGLLRDCSPHIRVVMLTGYGNLASAVSAIKLGAVDYLPKPIDADRLKTILLGDEDQLPEAEEDPMTPDRVRWEHIQRVHAECGGNVSETARKLKMHRRTLQRILAKHAPQ
jgi:two-component system response regulator RegA